MTTTIGTLAPIVPPVICDFGWDSGLALYTYTINGEPFPFTVASYSATVNYTPTADVVHSGTEYVCLANNGPGTSVVTPGSNSAVWESFPGRFNYYQTPLQTIVTFDATDSESLGIPKTYVPPGLSIIAYQWNFGNGLVGYGAQALTEYFYNQAPPDIQVMLTVTDNLGRQFYCAHYIDLAALTPSTSTGYAGYQIGAGMASPVFTVNLTDTLALADVKSRLYHGTRKPADAISTGESVAYTESNFPVGVTDTLTLSESANVITHDTAAVTDTLSLGESVSWAYPKMATLVDTFPGSSLSTTLWTVGAGTPSVTGNTLVEPCTSSYTEVYSNALYDLTSSFLYMKIVPPAMGNGSKESGYLLGQAQAIGEANNGVGWECFGTLQGFSVNTWVPVVNQGGTPTLGTTIAYSATTTPFLRIREAAGTVYWDYGSTATSWTNLWSTTYTIGLTALYCMIYSGYDVTETASNAVFSNVN